ncbi:imidazole glycerol phosphate synthase subunit HisH [Sphingorhabdus lutea]|uniref:Imidazole glycerol phosphate synthase subunit HisH n=1 Tax=Sphingorhabdus lutea TaxID=1913578 RepID=A0A1L3JBI2_9SPHN|nr:imidazole glycerol phosphate synthase subunit HisH [Sphingorhabdus lutea]APG62490.1 imidazole glycerol phosphate synthase subunit HisH [Sphingorhabdus lutea]
MIHIIDYGLGNLQAFLNVYKRLDIPAVRAKNADELKDATHLILPGVGAFDTAMDLFSESGMRGPVDEMVRSGNVAVIGVCVGMQMMAEKSEEGVRDGLGWIKGTVRSFRNNEQSASLPMPHMGWNDVTPMAGSPLFKGMEDDARFYFLHSFYFHCADKADCIAHADYGFKFDCSVGNGRVFGAQFHPEKSHHWGQQLLKNFAEI